jgi:protoporphyrinogen oxidase
MKKIAVIGAGPAGLTGAYQLAKAGFIVDVYEAGGNVGGMCKTIEIWGYKVDLGPHRFFSNNQTVHDFWIEHAGDDCRTVQRMTRIYYNKSYYHYPIQITEALKKSGFFKSVNILFSYLKEQVFPNKNPDNFENWVEQKFGRKLFEMFFKSYSEKLWGVNCKDIDADFAAQRIKQFSLLQAIANAIGLIRSRKHHTLVDRFAYPYLGTGMVYENLAEKIRELGGNIHLECPLVKVKQIGGDNITLAFSDGSVKTYDHVISTMPITTLINIMPDVPETLLNTVKKLRFRNTILVYLLIDGKDLFPDNWLYIHAAELKTGRVTNFRNWSPGLFGDLNGTVVSMEYWCNEDDELWTANEDELSGMAISELKLAGLHKGHNIVNYHVERIPKCYPVYLKGYKKILDPVIQHINSIAPLQAIGRYGAFKYNNQDHSILMGLLAAKNIIDDEDIDLWKVNTDYHSYLEAPNEQH